jgi:hypothetical protein
MTTTAEELLAEIEQHLNPPTEDEVIAEADSKRCPACEGSAVTHWAAGRWFWYFEHRRECLFAPDHVAPIAGQQAQDKSYANAVMRGLQLSSCRPRPEVQRLQRSPFPELLPAANTETRREGTPMTDNDHATVPLSLLAGEWSMSPEELITALGADRVLTDALEIRHVLVADAQELLAKRNAEAARHREADKIRSAAMERDAVAQRARIEAIQRQQAAVIANDPSLSALAVMLGEDHTTKMEHAGRTFDEYLAIERSGHVGTMTRYTPEKNG